MPAQGIPFDALARGIAKLVADRARVIDPDTKRPRPVQFGDVAVLARTKQHVEDIAHALKTARVPMKMSLAGLFKVPEVCLARACLRRLADPADTLASAEIGVRGLTLPSYKRGSFATWRQRRRRMTGSTRRTHRKTVGATAHRRRTNRR
jgi:superfamily I DNA/RNA helicase